MPSPGICQNPIFIREAQAYMIHTFVLLPGVAQTDQMHAHQAQKIFHQILHPYFMFLALMQYLWLTYTKLF